ncbi:MAG: HEPN domain-containing protein [Oscillospiraceae bacterium]|nr:HEPN domain-containing protein [Oscillospiraceae bacterium]
MKVVEDLILRGLIKKCSFSEDMYKKEFGVGVRDLESAKVSFEEKNYKWATVQAYYAIFHAVRALIYKSGYREKSHIALKDIFKELYIKTEELPMVTYDCLKDGMHLREAADYKNLYAKEDAENIIISVSESLKEIQKLVDS